MLAQLFLLIRVIRLVVLPYMGAFSTLLAFDAAWILKAIVVLVKPYFGGKIYA